MTDASPRPRAEYTRRLRELAATARRECERASRERTSRERVEGGDALDESRALEQLRTGLGPLLALYIEGHSGGRNVRFTGEELELFHRATNDWLRLYGWCYGVDLDPSVTVREAAELLVHTHDVRAVARLLTGIPRRE